MLTSRALSAGLMIALTGPVIAETSQYELSFEGRWTSDLPLVGSSHFTTLVGGTHTAEGSLFSIGGTASPGVEEVAELGGGITLVAEIEDLIDAGHANQSFFGTDFFIEPEETDTFTITVDSAFPLLTMITMIAPSPDWFTGVHDLSLVDSEGDWLPRIELDLMSYDAGTEDGTGLTLNNPASDPVSVILPLDIAEPNGVLFGAGSIARLTITRLAPGDTDGDGDVDDADLGTAFANYTGAIGAAGGLVTSDGDTDGDGDVDDADLGTAFSNYTGALAPASGPAAVPEPGTFGALTAAGLLLVGRRRRPRGA